MTAEQILVENDLDFNVSKRALQDADGNPSGYYGLYNDRLNKCINTVKEGYHVSQNKDIVDLVLEGIKPFDGTLSVQKGGIINEGRKVFLQLAIEGDGVIQNDRIKRYITVIDSNDGSTSLSIGVGDLTMSCQNQFFKFYKEGQSKFRHTPSLEEKMKEIPKLIGVNLEESFRRMELYKHLSETSIHSQLAHEFVNKMLGYDREITPEEDFRKLSTRSINTMNDLYDCIDIETKSKGMNLWGLHSGLTRYTTHKKPKLNRENGDVESLMFGGVYRMNQASLKFIEDVKDNTLVMS